MPYLAFHKTGLPDHTLPDGKLVIRNVDFRGDTKSVFCGGFVRNEAMANAENAIWRYVDNFGGTGDDWDIFQVTLVEYDAIESAVYQPLRDARAAADVVRAQDLRDLLVAQTVRVSDLASTDRVWRVPGTVAEAKEFFKALFLGLKEVEDKLLEDET